MASFLRPLIKRPDDRHRLVNQRNGIVMATTVITAFDSATRRRGLLRHTAMPDDAAMIIAPCNAVHTIGMRFDIDIAFVSKSGQILKTRHAVKPWRMTAALRAFAVIELAAGTLTRTAAAPGDMVAIA